MTKAQRLDSKFSQRSVIVVRWMSVWTIARWS